MIYEAVQDSDLTETHQKVGFQLDQVEKNSIILPLSINKCKWEQQTKRAGNPTEIPNNNFPGICRNINKLLKPVFPLLPTSENTEQGSVSAVYK